MAELTQRDDRKKQVSEILKSIDQLIKSGSIDMAMREIMNARNLDPANAYVHAYEQRIEYLRKEHEKHQAEEQTRVEAERHAQERDRQMRTLMEEEQRRLLEVQQKLNDEPKRPAGHAAIQAGKPADPQPARDGGDSSEIKKSRDTVLVIDDDAGLLETITQTLTMNGLEVYSLSTSDEAFTLLQKWVPGLILCDINLETSTMGGFSFYEAIRKLEYLDDVPFIFLTGLNDRVLIRTGKEMGVDDYLIKPISGDILVATVKGKLKRFALLNRKR